MHPVAEALPCVDAEAADAFRAGEQAQGRGHGPGEETRVGGGYLLHDRERPAWVAAGVGGAGEEGVDEPFHRRAVVRIVVQARLVGDEHEFVVAGDADAIDGDDGRVEAAQLELDPFDVAVDAEYDVDAVREQ